MSIAGSWAWLRTQRHLAFGLTSVSAVAAILVLFSSRSWFWRDEWQFILGRPFSDPMTWFLPHEEHIVVVHAAVFSALVALVGTTTYVPYLVVLLVTHVAYVTALYAFVDRHAGRRPALIVGAVMLLLGSAGLNIVWAFQMGPNAAAAMALWALLLIRDRPGWSAVLLSVGVLTAGFTLFFVPAAVLYGWSRKALLAACVPVMVYGIWFVLIGREAMVRHDNLSSIPIVIDWLAGGLVASSSAATGIGRYSLFIIVAVMPLLLRHPDRRAAMVGPVALLTEYVLLGLRRDGLNIPGGWQYVYFGASFVLLTLAIAWPGLPRWARPAGALVAGVAVVSNTLAMITLSSRWPEVMAAQDPMCTLCSIP